MRLRQVALAARELLPAVDALCDVLGIRVGFRDPGVAEFGLTNAVMPVGETFVEVVSPERADASAQRWIERRGGDAGYMLILQCEPAELDAEVARAERAGARVVWSGEREGGRTVHFHPRELGAILSFDAMPSWDAWVWAGPGWREHVATGTTAEVCGAELSGPDPEALAEYWGAVVGVAPRPGAEAAPEIALSRGGRLRFTRGKVGLSGVELKLVDPVGFSRRAGARGLIHADGSAQIAGTRFYSATSFK